MTDESRFSAGRFEALERHLSNLEERMIDPRDFGRLEQQVESLTERLDEMSKTLDEINKTLIEARGGWRLLMLLGGAGAAAGSVLTWALSHIKVSI